MSLPTHTKPFSYFLVSVVDAFTITFDTDDCDEFVVNLVYHLEFSIASWLSTVPKRTYWPLLDQNYP